MPRSVHVTGSLALGGPAYSIPRLCQALREIGADAKVMSVQAPGDPEARADANDQRFRPDFAKAPVLQNLRVSGALQHALQNEARESDVIHDHGLWLAANLYAGWTAKEAAKPLVVSPRGMLNEQALAFSAQKKRAFWSLLQGPAFKNAACYHATSIGEYHDIRAFGLKAPVAVIPNAIDLLPLPERSLSDGSRTVLFLGRLHPIKGIDTLVKAWAISRRPGWRLDIVGGDEKGYAEEIEKLAASLNLDDVRMMEAVSGQDKLLAYRSADLFVLPSRSENFAITVAEALAAETPVISTKGAPWEGLHANQCGWWIDHGVAPMAEALSHAMALPRAGLRDMGANGRNWMAREFQWARVAEQMRDVYRWLLDGGDPPRVVRLG